jgi:xanthine dehydrogenase small subunit
VAGCTDVGLWVTKLHALSAGAGRHPRQGAAPGRAYPHHIAIGAAVTLTDAFAALVADRPQLQAPLPHRFAGLPVRNSARWAATWPMARRLATHAAADCAGRQRGADEHEREVAHPRDAAGRALHRLPPERDGKDEVLAWIKVPKPEPASTVRVYKISKRFDDDISAVCLAMNLHREDGVVRRASIGAGGVAATPVRARPNRGRPARPAVGPGHRERHQPRCGRVPAHLRHARLAAYRSEVLGNLLQRFWLESQGQTQINLEVHP